MQAKIRLIRFVSDDQTLPDAQRQAWPVQILAEGINMDDHVFVYHVGTPNDPIPGDRFECVASVNQLYEIPKTQGVSLTTQTGIPYYRSNVLEYVARSAAEADEIHQKVVEEVQLLVKNWNASLRLKATSIVEVTEDLASNLDMNTQPPIRLTLSYHPAGVVGVSDLKPVITSPDPNQVGWLPVSVLGAGANIPPGAKFYYNYATDATFGDLMPAKQPWSGHQFYRNGIQMPYGLVWVMDARTLWWMDFDPATIPGYRRVGASEDWGAPWPQDYVNRSNPGAVPNLLHFILFQ